MPIAEATLRSHPRAGAPPHRPQHQGFLTGLPRFRDAGPEAEKAFRSYRHIRARGWGELRAAAPCGRLITGAYRQVKVW